VWGGWWKDPGRRAFSAVIFGKCYFSNKTTYKPQFPVRPRVLVWFVYLARLKLQRVT
jgi:hypothetical protein